MTVKWWEGPMLGFDLECTGKLPLEDRPVSYCFAEVGGGRPPEIVHRVVNPERSSHPEAVEIHGITDERAAREGDPLGSAVEYILDRLANASARGIPVVGMNLSYDLSMVNHLSWELGIPPTGWGSGDVLGLVPSPCIDLMVIDKQVDPYRLTKEIGGRTLGNICAHYGVAHAKAHDAQQDTLAACRAAWKIGRLSGASNVELHAWYEQRRDSYNPPRNQYRGSTPWLHQFQALHQLNSMDLAELHAAQVIWRNEQARHLQEWLRKNEDAAAVVDPYWPVIPCGLEDRDLYEEALL